ncbi:hypothetical protein B0G57_1106 [Trinickia symbiotica]|uniref:hypothetical protein n=1 Tax=Trinickia symbiotica TaxID=863227 RepID=UPI000D4FCA74|nr:hypothetical protein [Trinickia symbiotica]PPK43934.1 hypothetical protein B0G57_1106 [Trinickia symbiotica]
MLDTDFLSLCFIASMAFGGDVYAACETAQHFDATRHMNPTNLARILARGFELNERTHTWLVGGRGLTVEQFAQEVALSGRVHDDIRNRWRRPVLIRRTYL